MQILYIPNDCSATEHLPFPVWGGVQATSGELRPRNGPPVCKALVFVDFCGFCLRIPGVARIVRPHPHYRTSVFYSVGQVCLQITVSRQKFDYSFLYLLALEDQFNATEDAVVHLDTFRISAAR